MTAVVRLQSNNAIYYDDDLLVGIDQTFSTDTYVVVSGWIIGKKRKITSFRIAIEDCEVEAEANLPRPQLQPVCERYGQDTRCGFRAIVPRSARHEIRFSFGSGEEATSRTAEIRGRKGPVLPGFEVARDVFTTFISKVNAGHLHLLEIGSRNVAPMTTSKRSLFAGAASYTGFDYYPDDNTDVVGDAHRLSSYFPDRRFGAVYSASVFEHLAMPWLVALEINKVMEIGGWTFHSAPCAVPIHERPWDFWRYTEETFKVLFSRPLGFEVVKSGYLNPMRIYPEEMRAGYEMMPGQITFHGVQILARKIAEVDPDRFRWDMTIEEAMGADSHYPAPVSRQG